jgi:phosphotriesterase-related protein
MSTIKTVCGEIKPEELGLTSMHEHLLCDFTEMMKISNGPELCAQIDRIPQSMLTLNMSNLARLRNGMGTFSRDCTTIGDIDYTVGELKAFGALGGKSVVDATPMCTSVEKMPGQLKVASEKSGIHIVTCTGLYTASTQPEIYVQMTEDALVRLFSDQMENGLGGTGIKPGFMKCAINTPGSTLGVDDAEIKAVRACARVAAEKGCSIHIHNGYPMGMQECTAVAQMVLDLGVKPDKLLMLHMDSLIRRPHHPIDYIRDFSTTKTVNIDLQERLLQMGVNIGFDSWDMPTTAVPDNADRLKALAELLRRGYGGQITMGHDVYDKSRGVAYGYTGFTGFVQNALPILHELGFEQDIHRLTTENPARILAY